MTEATVTYLGRILTLTPASLGKSFEDACTVTVMESRAPSHETGWKRTRVAVPKKMWWYDTHPETQEQVFCAYSGYGDRIIRDVKALGLPVTVVDKRPNGLEAPDLTVLKGIEWRPHQREVFSKLLGYRGGVIKCSVAFGKSHLIRQLARVYKTSKIVITVASLDVAKTLYDELSKLLPEVGFCGTGCQRPGRVTVAVTQSLANCPADANLVLVDEAHCAMTASKIKLLTRFYRAKLFGLTATPEGRSDGADGYLEAVFGSIIAEVSYQDAVESGNVVQLKATMLRLHEGPDLSGIERKDLVDGIGIIRNDRRNALLIKAIKDLEVELGSDAQILVMVDKVEHAYRLGQMLPDYTIITGSVDSERKEELLEMGAMLPEQKLCTPKERDKCRKLFELGKLKHVIATRVWDKGVSFNDLQGLVRADGLASPIAAGQIPGRLSRLGNNVDKKFGRLIDVMDLFTPALKGRSYSRLRSYKSYGWEIDYA